MTEHSQTIVRSTLNDSPSQAAPLRTVVTGVDGSDDGLRAVDYATVIAHHHDAAMVIAAVIDSASSLGLVGVGQIHQAAATAVAAGARRAMARGVAASRVRTVILDGNAGEVLAAQARHGTVVVLGHRSATAWSRVLRGSVSLDALSHSRYPLIIVPAGWTWTEQGGSIGALVRTSQEAHALITAAAGEARARQQSLVIFDARQPLEPSDVDLSWRSLCNQIGEIDVRVHSAPTDTPIAVAELAAGFDVLFVAKSVRASRADLTVWRPLIERASCPIEFYPVAGEGRTPRH